MKTLETLKNEKFALEMKDHWTSEDFETARRLSLEISKIENPAKVVKPKAMTEEEKEEYFNDALAQLKKNLGLC